MAKRKRSTAVPALSDIERAELFNQSVARSQRRMYEGALSEPDGLFFLGLGEFESGAFFIERTFNVRNDPGYPYTFPDDVRQRAAELLRELFFLWKDNKQRMVVSRAGLAAADPKFQRFVQDCIGGRAAPSGLE